MRILLVVPGRYHEERSRAAQRLQLLLAGLVDAGHDVEVITNKWWDQQSQTRHHRWTTHVAAGSDELSARQVATRIRRRNPDIVHFIETPAQIVALTSVVTNVPLLYENPGLTSPLIESWLQRRVDRALDEVIVPSEIVETELVAADISTDISIIPDPIDDSLITAVAPLSGADVVWGARSLEHANLEDLLLALAELDEAEFAAAVFLEQDIPQARAAIDTYDLAHQVDIFQDTTRRERLAIYRGADMYVQTANECPFAAELLWAMAAGCIGVVQYQPRSSAHELVAGHSHGLSVSNPDDLVEGMLEASELPASEYERDFASYDIAAIVEQLTARYRNAVNRET